MRRPLRFADDITRMIMRGRFALSDATPIGPRILIVVLTLGHRDEYLAQTLASIRVQDAEPADIVVVAPSAAAGARRLAREMDARILDDPGGFGAAIDAGLASAEPCHQYVNWIGDDDLLADGGLAAAAGALDADPSATVAFGDCEYIDSAGRLLWTNRTGRIAPWLMTWGPDLVPQPGALIRAASLRAVGGIDTSLFYALDLDLWLRLRGIGRFAYTGRPLAAFRWHPTSSTVANRSASLDEAEAVKRRYYSPKQRRLAILWERPVRIATRLAARRLNRLARRQPFRPGSPSS
jgi:GT2 family glycosyltransferase